MRKAYTKIFKPQIRDTITRVCASEGEQGILSKIKGRHVGERCILYYLAEMMVVVPRYIEHLSFIFNQFSCLAFSPFIA